MHSTIPSLHPASGNLTLQWTLVADLFRHCSFLKMVSSGADTSVINYSKRFTLTQMTGTFSSRVKTGILSVSDTDGPAIKEDDGREELRKRQKDMFTVPYEDQLTGLTRYAPMAKQPGTTITAKTPKPQYPTSSYVVATTFLPKPTIVTTLTAPQTFSTSSIENTVCTTFLSLPVLVQLLSGRLPRLLLLPILMMT